MKYLTYEDRKILEKLLNNKTSIRAAALILGRSHSVICYELKMNKGNHLPYDAARAQGFHERRILNKGNKGKINENEKLREYITEKLSRHQWSPEQIAGRLKREPDETVGYACAETIYVYIYGRDGIKGKYYIHLRRHRLKRGKWHARSKRETIPERTSIHERPEAVAEKTDPGHWESDSMIFSQQKGILSVQAERKTLLARLTKCANKTAAETNIALTRTIDSVPSPYVISFTFDNGTENVLHTELRKLFGIETWFCDPYCSWQKGLVENTNMLIRQYLPLNTPIDSLSDDDIQLIEDKLNNRPRKTLNYLTPNEYFKVLTEGGLISTRI
jgi:IS30 family transposase